MGTVETTEGITMRSQTAGLIALSIIAAGTSQARADTDSAGGPCASYDWEAMQPPVAADPALPVPKANFDATRFAPYVRAHLTS